MVMRDVRAKHQTDENVIQTTKARTYLSGKHKQSDEEYKERDGAHGLQVFENSWSWRAEKTVATEGVGEWMEKKMKTHKLGHEGVKK